MLVDKFGGNDGIDVVVVTTLGSTSTNTACDSGKFRILYFLGILCVLFGDNIIYLMLKQTQDLHIGAFSFAIKKPSFIFV